MLSKQEMLSKLEPSIFPLGCYVHIPFCLSKCNYCDFLSQPFNKDLSTKYVKALAIEIRNWGKRLQKPIVDTIYFGGGTPAILALPQLKALITACFDAFQVTKDAEISIEANPGTIINPETITNHKLKELRKIGFNRISFGVQSTHPRHLTHLGRTHTVNQVRESIEAARETGWDNLNLDLIFGIPGQTLKEWEETIKTALKHKPDHLSAYILTIEEGTIYGKLFADGVLVLPQEETVVRMYNKLLKLLGNDGYLHYEISNFSLPGKECQHNLKYWQYKEYLGLGTGAVSFINGIRFKKESSLAKYIGDISNNSLSIVEVEYPSLKTKFFERLMLGLRLKKGIALNKFSSDEKELFGTSIAPKLLPYIDAGLLIKEKDNLRFTSKGWFLSNEVLQALVL